MIVDGMKAKVAYIIEILQNCTLVPVLLLKDDDNYD